MNSIQITESSSFISLELSIHDNNDLYSQQLIIVIQETYLTSVNVSDPTAQGI